MISQSCKKPLIFWFGFLFYLLSATMLLGCKAKQKTITETTVDIQKFDKDSSNVVTINKAIDDHASITFPPVKTPMPECDSICDQVAQQYLGMINMVKQSGDISYSLLYDKYTRTLAMKAKIGETKTVTTRIYYNITKTLDKTKETKIPVRYTPDYMRYSAYFGWLAALFLIFRIVKKIYTLWLPKNSFSQ